MYAGSSNSFEGLTTVYSPATCNGDTFNNGVRDKGLYWALDNCRIGEPKMGIGSGPLYFKNQTY